jgi:TrpR family trp operon transcriptional repressor
MFLYTVTLLPIVTRMSSNSSNNIEELARILAAIEDPELIKSLLECLFTGHELEEVSGRWELVKMLDRGVSQRKIAGALHMSLCKITRGSRELQKKDSAFKRVLEEYL